MINIGNRKVGAGETPFIIAEMSGNHNQSLDRALAIVDAAAKAGAHAIKLQTYTADTMTLNVRMPGFVIEDPKSLWYGRQLYELYEEAHTPWEWHKPIMDRSAQHGIECFSTPFDETAVDFLEELGVPAYKIASFECTDIPLIKKVASTGKPMIISTGMASLAEIDEAVRTAREGGCNQIILLKCTSTYPATPESTNILTIPHMRKAFGCQVGLSDHTMGCGVAVAAVALGATVIEKHFTMSRADGGVDSAFSMEPEELRRLQIETGRAWLGLGRVAYGGTQAEQKSKIFRRSLYISRDSKEGDVLSEKNVRIIRPGFGLEPKYYPLLIGKKLAKDAAAGSPLCWDLVG